MRAFCIMQNILIHSPVQSKSELEEIDVNKVFEVSYKEFSLNFMSPQFMTPSLFGKEIRPAVHGSSLRSAG